MHAAGKHPHAAGLEGEPAAKRPHVQEESEAASASAALDAVFTRGRRDQQAGPRRSATTRWRSLAPLLTWARRGGKAAAATAPSVRSAAGSGGGCARPSDDAVAARDYVAGITAGIFARVAGGGDDDAAGGAHNSSGGEGVGNGVLAAAAARALALGDGGERSAARSRGAPVTPCPSLGSPPQDARGLRSGSSNSNSSSSARGAAGADVAWGASPPAAAPPPEHRMPVPARSPEPAVATTAAAASNGGRDGSAQQRSPFAAASGTSTPLPSAGAARAPPQGWSQPGSAGSSLGRSLCTVPERSGLREPPPTPAYSRAQSQEPLPFARSAPTTPPSTPMCLSTSPSAASAAAIPPPLALAAEAAAAAGGDSTTTSSGRAGSGSFATPANTPVTAGSGSNSGRGSGALGAGASRDISSGQLAAAMRGLAVGGDGRGASASATPQEAADGPEHGDSGIAPCGTGGSVLVAQVPRPLLPQLSARAPLPPEALAGADATRPNRSVTELPPAERPACWEDDAVGADAPVGGHGLDTDAGPPGPARAAPLLNRRRGPLWGCTCLAVPQTLDGDDSD
ncbi:hypothetical protein Rsub_01759 [Raphidocelis subcapitata]|uniref:Uncharacterized protein n=1 Tax=Raphidocelis subcapitata TaxID=307507 RepID=A0A2V0NQZ1_9CHLO|nr:hypothetical protein Rsub_01759 [Raphidocelis subcapitata]|eukprot:GBF89042.1 hypothetical protein Rsub_01759 [Raphidocelis subcapitata]